MRLGFQSMLGALGIRLSKGIQLLAAIATILTAALTITFWPSDDGNAQTNIHESKGPVVGRDFHGDVHYYMNENKKSHNATADEFVVGKNQMHPAMDGQIEIVVTRMFNSITGRGENISRAHISVRIPKFRDYSFRGMKEGSTESFEFREREYRIHMTDIDLYEETARLNITGPF